MPAGGLSGSVKKAGVDAEGVEGLVEVNFGEKQELGELGAVDGWKAAML
jgi:hypothetical protein